MTEVAAQINSGENIENVKRLKANLNFWSPLNDNFNVPDKKSACTWHKNANRQSTPHSTKDWKRTSKILPNALAAIGNTPMIKLNKIPQAEGLKCEVYVKCEFLNPGGSVKDRIAFRVVEDAERQGLLKPGSTIIEPTSGNTGIGLAMAAAVKGYRCVIVMSEKMSNEKVSVLTALGAEIVRTPVNADSNSAEGMFGVTHRLRKEIPNSVILDQYSNPGNPLAHYDTTAEEIYDQCDKKVDMIVIGAGTGGTVCGIGRKFKEISPETKIVAADPEGSLLALPSEKMKRNILLSSNGKRMTYAWKLHKYLSDDSDRFFFRWWDVKVTELKLEKLQTATMNMNCERVLNIMKKSGFDQIPVVDNGGGIVGMLTLQNLMNGLISGKAKSNESIETCIVRIYPKVYKTANLGVVSRILERESYVIILDAQGTGSSQVDKPVAIVTAIDLLQFVQKKS
nr:cystathionine beta-synthase-like [Leptinotarsa decemlineata]